MPNVHDDDQETLWFADESEWMEDMPITHLSESGTHYTESGTDYYQPLDREWVALLAENTGPESARIDAIRVRAVQAQNIALAESPADAAVRAERDRRNAEARREDGYELWAGYSADPTAAKTITAGGSRMTPGARSGRRPGAPSYAASLRPARRRRARKRRRSTPSTSSRGAGMAGGHGES